MLQVAVYAMTQVLYAGVVTAPGHQRLDECDGQCRARAESQLLLAGKKRSRIQFERQSGPGAHPRRVPGGFQQTQCGPVSNRLQHRSASPVRVHAIVVS